MQEENRVLIVEPNPYHGEILPGFVKYFRDLGYKTDLLLRNCNKVDDIFCRFKEKPNVTYGGPKEMRFFLKNVISGYKYIFLASSAYWTDYEYIGSYLDYLGFVPKAKNGILMIEHNIIPYLKEYKEEEYLKNKRLFTLSGFQDTPILNPHFFGENIKITQKNKEITIFIVIGILTKNSDLLLSSVSELAKTNNNFKVVVVGNGEFEIPKKLKRYIEFKGRLNYRNMYSEIEKADYILPLLDYSMELHKRYTTGTTTGARQLIMGFLKPCIIEEPFAKSYNFDDKNSIIYKGQNMADGMKRGIQMSNDEYRCMQNNLKEIEKKLYIKSLNNLREAI